MVELLLDTTYLLPIFGISVGLKNFDKSFGKLLRSYSVHYSPASLVEAKWTVLKLGRKNPERREALFTAYRTGLKVLASDGRLKETALTNEVVEKVADELLTKEDVKDYFDRLIYGTAADRGCALLTEDEKLSKLKRRETPRPIQLLTWKHMLSS
jgi:PIN domain nuclease of toxin-antitoxin system